eukprot:m.15924 g.15924  ORF g.15924 m.15924 type:complete len:475 (-) comp10788_c0_seq1:50-1474(-)
MQLAQDAKGFKWDRKSRVAFASLLVVKLPANYTFPENAQQIEGWRVRQRPALHSKAVGTLKVGQRFEATERMGLWLKLNIPNSKKTGWALAEIDGVQYLRPVFPQVVYPWQRARGSGLMYEDVLCKRREELRKLDLAKDNRLVNEWIALISELDAVLRLTRGFAHMIQTARKSAKGSYALSASVRRPRSNSFSTAKKSTTPIILPSEAKISDDINRRRPRSNTFTQKTTLTDDSDDDEDNTKEQWTAWREDYEVRRRKNPFNNGDDVIVKKVSPALSQQDLEDEERKLLMRARAEAQARIERENKHSENISRLESANRLNRREVENQEKEQTPTRPRSNTLTSLNGFNEPDVSELYKWSWEKRGLLDPKDFAVDPLLGKDEDSRRNHEDDHRRVEVEDDRGQNFSFHSDENTHTYGQNTHPNKYSPKLSPRGRQRVVAAPHVPKATPSPSKRSLSLPCRKADGARHNLFIAAGN